jgi:hypothetical protein
VGERDERRDEVQVMEVRMIKTLSQVEWIVLAACSCRIAGLCWSSRTGRGTGDNANGGYLDAGYSGPKRDDGSFSSGPEN